ncbi:hypothetical protein C9374_005475 [Naegleria lovaniensis]|uniref:Uncharacterized protein n=1 Tax=Naegleria lovaniensis TaxID=51637 RepID=A0AA88GQF6_NAELO|nr:uncharacterized protein C9374_005475 [Naegleria lovaniensis]KAG2382273.1 hypothetical protein C9374_005475 [Naegleria lovaniensis]
MDDFQENKEGTSQSEVGSEALGSSETSAASVPGNILGSSSPILNNNERTPSANTSSSDNATSLIADASPEHAPSLNYPSFKTTEEIGSQGIYTYHSLTKMEGYKYSSFEEWRWNYVSGKTYTPPPPSNIYWWGCLKRNKEPLKVIEEQLIKERKVLAPFVLAIPSTLKMLDEKIMNIKSKLSKSSCTETISSKSSSTGSSRGTFTPTSQSSEEVHSKDGVSVVKIDNDSNAKESVNSESTYEQKPNKVMPDYLEMITHLNKKVEELTLRVRALEEEKAKLSFQDNTQSNKSSNANIPVSVLTPSTVEFEINENIPVVDNFEEFPTCLHVEKQWCGHKRVAAVDEVKLFVLSDDSNPTNSSCRNLGMGVLMIDEQDDLKKQLVLKAENYWLVLASCTKMDVVMLSDRYVSIVMESIGSNNLPNKVSLVLIFKEKTGRDDFLTQWKNE